jgi:hypothetical protein
LYRSTVIHISKLNIQNKKEIYIKKYCKHMMYLNPFMDQRSASSWERVWKGTGRYLSQVEDRGDLSTRAPLLQARMR